MLKVLVIEDNDRDAELMRYNLVRHFGADVDLRTVSSLDAMQQALVEQKWDVIVCDYRVPGFEWPRPFMLALAVAPGTPFIVVSGVFGDEFAEAAKAAFSRGADAYLPKSEFARLGETIALAMATVKAATRRDQAVQGLREALPTDRNREDGV